MTSLPFDFDYPNSVPTYLALTPRFDSLLKAINELSDLSIGSLEDLNQQPVSGGSINEASLLTLNESKKGQVQLFLKQNSLDKYPLLLSESLGLAALQQAGVHTCQPLAVGRDTDIGCGFLLLSMIHPTQGSNSATGYEDLAGQLATLHQALPPQPNLTSNQEDVSVAEKFSTHKNQTHWVAGWFEDNYIGSSPQSNTWTADWHEFFATQRLGSQTKMAYDQGYLNRQTLQRIERLQHKLDHYLPNYSQLDNHGNPRPSLLHGDLWSGNAMMGNAVKGSNETLGYLIDPAVYVGHPETDLAMTHLFGGFTPEFYEVYLAHCPVADGFTERMDVYNLYHYLNHLNLFGTGYLNAVQCIAQRFGG